jgi:hypothetical protein
MRDKKEDFPAPDGPITVRKLLFYSLPDNLFRISFWVSLSCKKIFFHSRLILLLFFSQGYDIRREIRRDTCCE